MNTPRKPRGDSVLKTLPPERQSALAEHAAAHTLAETVSWLSADGVETSSAALSQFLSWFLLRQQLERNNSTVREMLAELKREQPDLSDDQMFRVGQMYFTALAIEQKDSLSWKRAQDAAAKRKVSEQNDRRLVLLEQKAKQAEQAETVTNDATLTAEEKQQRIRQIFGMG